MQVFDHHIVFDEITYDREELKDWYESVKQYQVGFGKLMNKFANKHASNNMTHNKRFKEGSRIGRFDSIDTYFTLGKHVKDFDPIKKLVDQFNFDQPLQGADVDILIYGPGYNFVPHIDFHMYCGIMFPILPDSDASPIDFYRMPPGSVWQRATSYPVIPKRDLIYSYNYSLDHPSMFNGHTIHGVRNNDKQRVFLRLKCLSMNFSQVIEKALAGNFILPAQGGKTA
jgi:hypothetical protein